MEISVDELGGLTRKLTVVLPRDYVSREMDAAYKKLKTDVSFKGFRKGKIPQSLLKKSYGDRVEKDVAEKIIQDTYFDALGQSKIDAVAHPEIKKHSFGDDGSFRYEAEVDVRPVFELGTYKGLEIEVADTVVTDEEVGEELERLRKEMAPLRSVGDRAVQLHDVVVIDFSASHNGELIKQVSGKDYSIDVGSGVQGKEFEEALIGLRNAEETVREVEFPASLTNPLLAGKKVEFTINVHDVKERVLPEIDDEFAKDIDSEFNILDDLKEHIRTNLRQTKEESREGELSDKIMKQLLDTNNFEVPNRLVVYEAEMHLKEMENNLSQQGKTLESAGLNRDEMVKRFREVAAKRVKGDFIIKKIADEEKITVSKEDIDKGFERVAQQYNMPIEETKEYFRAREYLLPFMSELLNEKVLKILRDATVIKTGPASEKNNSQGEKQEQTAGETE